MPSSSLFLSHLTLTEEEGAPPRVMLLGYSLPLSPSEAAILRACMTAETSHASAPTAKELASLLSSDGEVSEGAVSVLVHRINRKAAAISGRKLIVGVSHHGFRVNPYL